MLPGQDCKCHLSTAVWGTAVLAQHITVPLPSTADDHLDHSFKTCSLVSSGKRGRYVMKADVKSDALGSCISCSSRRFNCSFHLLRSPDSFESRSAATAKTQQVSLAASPAAAEKLEKCQLPAAAAAASSNTSWPQAGRLPQQQQLIGHHGLGDLQWYAAFAVNAGYLA